MPIIQCYVDDETMKYLELASSELDRKVAELAEAAISNAAIEFKVSRMGAAHTSQQREGDTNA